MSDMMTQSQVRNFVEDEVFDSGMFIDEYMERLDGGLYEAGLQNLNTQNKEEIEGIQNGISDIESTVEKMEGDVLDLESEIDDIKEKIDELEEDGNTTDDEEEEIFEIEKTISSISSSIESYEKEISSMQDDLAYEEERSSEFEVYEWYFVSNFLYRKLLQKNEIVGEILGMNVWGRQCSGQAVWLDSVIQSIASDAKKTREFDYRKIYQNFNGYVEVKKTLKIEKEKMSAVLFNIFVEHSRLFNGDAIGIETLEKMMIVYAGEKEPEAEALNELVQLMRFHGSSIFTI